MALRAANFLRRDLRRAQWYSLSSSQVIHRLLRNNITIRIPCLINRSDINRLSLVFELPARAAQGGVPAGARDGADVREGGDFAEGGEAGGEAIGAVGAGDGGHGAAWVAVGVVPANGRAEGEREGDE